MAATQATPEEARATATNVARASYGRLVAILASRNGSIADAEDALSEAFARALAVWPRDGIPQNPEAWLVTVARNRQIDTARSAAARTTSASVDDESMQNIASLLDDIDPEAIPEKRLELLFACAHPAIDATVHTPLMLQTVLGFKAADIASAYLMPMPTLEQRLVRAKRKIRQAGVPFSIPERDAMSDRLPAVLEALYGAYTLGWEQPQDEATEDMAGEALYLVSVLTGLLPDEREVLGLDALISFSHARRDARFDADGAFVPLDRQPAERWDRTLMRRGSVLLSRAAQAGSPGRFQLEAAIQALHADRLATGRIDWPAICQLYEGLMAVAPSSGAAVARAAAVGHAKGPDAGLNALSGAQSMIGERAIDGFQPYWATRAHLLRMAGRRDEAFAAYDKAISLTTEIPVRLWLVAQRREQSGD